MSPGCCMRTLRGVTGPRARMRGLAGWGRDGARTVDEAIVHHVLQGGRHHTGHHRLDCGGHAEGQRRHLRKLERERGENGHVRRPEAPDGVLKAAGLSDGLHRHVHLTLRQLGPRHLTLIDGAVEGVLDAAALLLVLVVRLDHQLALFIDVDDVGPQPLAAHVDEGLDRGQRGHVGAAKEAEHDPKRHRHQLFGRPGVGKVQVLEELEIQRQQAAEEVPEPFEHRQQEAEDGQRFCGDRHVRVLELCLERHRLLHLLIGTVLELGVRGLPVGAERLRLPDGALCLRLCSGCSRSQRIDGALHISLRGAGKEAHGVPRRCMAHALLVKSDGRSRESRSSRSGPTNPKHCEKGQVSSPISMFAMTPLRSPPNLTAIMERA